MIGTGFWGGIMEQGVRGLKDEKISLSILGLVVMVAVYSYSWAQETFVDESTFNKHTEDVQSKLDRLSETMDSHVEEYRIVEASRVIRDIKRDIQLAVAMEEPSYQINELKEQLAHAEEYKRCLVSRMPNCQHLRWPE
jgi:hypothetical protein